MVFVSLEESTSSRRAASIAMLDRPSRAPSKINCQIMRFVVGGFTPGLRKRGLKPATTLRYRDRDKSGTPFIRIRVPLQHHKRHVLTSLHNSFRTFEVLNVANIKSLVAEIGRASCRERV